MFEQLRTAVEMSTAMFDKEKAQERLSKLSGGVAVYKVHIHYLTDFCGWFYFNAFIASLHLLPGWRG